MTKREAIRAVRQAWGRSAKVEAKISKCRVSFVCSRNPFRMHCCFHDHFIEGNAAEVPCLGGRKLFWLSAGTPTSMLMSGFGESWAEAVVRLGLKEKAESFTQAVKKLG